MASRLGSRAERLARVRALRTRQGAPRTATLRLRRSRPCSPRRVAAGFPIEELYATEAAYESMPLLRELDAARNAHVLDR